MLTNIDRSIRYNYCYHDKLRTGEEEEKPMVTLKVRKVGNSLGFTLPLEAAAKLKVEEGDTLYLTETPDGYRITAYDPVFVRQMEIAQRVMREDRNILRALANV